MIVPATALPDDVKDHRLRLLQSAERPCQCDEDNKDVSPGSHLQCAPCWNRAYLMRILAPEPLQEYQTPTTSPW